jgi:hypothetical protein
MVPLILAERGADRADFVRRPVLLPGKTGEEARPPAHRAREAKRDQDEVLETPRFPMRENR